MSDGYWSKGNLQEPKRAAYEMRRRLRRGQRGVGPVLDALQLLTQDTAIYDQLKAIADEMRGDEVALACAQQRFWDAFPSLSRSGVAQLVCNH